jgi:hypothetical protein
MVGADADPSLTAEEAGQLAMVQTVLVGAGAGATAALLFAVASGTALSLLLALLAPLPILIVALGWSSVAGIVASISAAAMLAASLGFPTSLGFLLGVGAPASWLGYLSLLARPAHNGAASNLEWYPTGRLVLWAAVLGTVMVVVSLMITLGTEWPTFQAGLRKVTEEIVELQARAGRDPAAVERLTTKEMIDALTATLPGAVAVFATLINCFNLWLAGRIVHVSGRLRRPWPDLPAMQLPPLAPAILAASLVGLWLPEFASFIAASFAASLITVFTFVGLAVMHAITRGIASRPLMLAALYVSIVPLAGLPLLLASLLGLAESVLNIRARVAASRPPPPPPPYSRI